jgi:hypothetical protein
MDLLFPTNQIGFPWGEWPDTAKANICPFDISTLPFGQEPTVSGMAKELILRVAAIHGLRRYYSSYDLRLLRCAKTVMPHL